MVQYVEYSETGLTHADTFLLGIIYCWMIEKMIDDVPDKFDDLFIYLDQNLIMRWQKIWNIAVFPTE